MYIPLGGNRRADCRKYANVFTVMIIGGLWHGASWNFLIWGALHGGYLVIYKLLTKKIPLLEESVVIKSKKIRMMLNDRLDLKILRKFKEY